MNPCDLNVLVTAITNYLYATLDPKDFACLNVFLSELSKSMFSMALFRDICDKQNWWPLAPPPAKEAGKEKEQDAHERA